MTTANHTNSNQKIHEALELLNEAARDKQSEIHDLLAGKYKELRSTMARTEKKLIKRERALVKQSEDYVASMASAVDQRVHEEPWTALGWVSVGALLIGYILGRRD